MIKTRLLFTVSVFFGAMTVRGEVVSDWNLELRETVRVLRVSPPAASRVMAMVHTAMYDAVNAVEGTHLPYRYSGPVGLGGVSAEAAGAKAARDVMAVLFPSRAARFDALLGTQLSGLGNGAGVSAGLSLGAGVASDMLAWRSTDGSNNPSNYVPVIEPGRWRPTGPGFAEPLLPQWGSVVPFGIASASVYRPVAPPALSSAEYAAALNEVKEIGSATSATRTAEQTNIAQFWANGAGTETPPGHWNRIAMLAGAALGTAERARMLAMLNVALADAAIVSWDCKYHYDLWRPITAIRLADTDGNDATAADPAWSPLLVTPPFSEYTSGHSTFSAAGAEALGAFFGTDSVPFSVGSDDIVGLERSFPGFMAAAEEAGLSRIYGGIHFSFGNVNGLSSGRAVGDFVSANYFGVIPEPAGVVWVVAAAAVVGLRRKR